jgi:aryl-alcohol dehydrogenase-like predicted oxidoreductase
LCCRHHSAPGTGICNEELVGKAIKIHGRDKLINSKNFCITINKDGQRGVDGSEATILSQLSDSLRRLGTDYIDLYYQHRMDPKTPIEDTMRVLSRLVSEGKIRYIGLSECTPDELRRAHAIHPVTAIQMEWSLQSRDLENSVIPVARELGVGIVPYSPLGRGFLTGQFRTAADIAPNDYRSKMFPRFQAGNFEENVSKLDKFFEKATALGCTPAQLALAWVIAQGEDVVPIPGTKSVSRLLDNFGAVEVASRLTQADVAEIASFVDEPAGDRYSDMSTVHNARL